MDKRYAIPGTTGFFSPVRWPDRRWDPQRILSNGYRSLSSGIKWPGRDADHSTPSSAEVKNAWSWTFTPHPPAWRGAYLRTGDNFAFYRDISVRQTPIFLPLTQIYQPPRPSFPYSDPYLEISKLRAFCAFHIDYPTAVFSRTLLCMATAVFSAVTPRSLAGCYKHHGRTYRLRLNTDDHNRQLRRRKNLIISDCCTMYYNMHICSCHSKHVICYTSYNTPWRAYYPRRHPLPLLCRKNSDLYVWYNRMGVFTMSKIYVSTGIYS